MLSLGAEIVLKSTVALLKKLLPPDFDFSIHGNVVDMPIEPEFILISRKPSSGRGYAQVLAKIYYEEQSGFRVEFEDPRSTHLKL